MVVKPGTWYLYKGRERKGSLPFRVCEVRMEEGGYPLSWWAEYETGQRFSIGNIYVEERCEEYAVVYCAECERRWCPPDDYLCWSCRAITSQI